MTVTKEQLLADIDSFTQADAAHAAARDATIAAKDHTQSVTLIEQGNIDSAVAQYDVNTNEAKAEEASAVSAEDVAATAEDDAKNKLIADVQEFAAQG